MPDEPGELLLKGSKSSFEIDLQPLSAVYGVKVHAFHIDRLHHALDVFVPECRAGFGVVERDASGEADDMCVFQRDNLVSLQ